MTLQEFQQSIREGIPAELPAPKPYDPEVNHAPKRKDILTKEEKTRYPECLTLFRTAAPCCFGP